MLYPLNIPQWQKFRRRTRIIVLIHDLWMAPLCWEHSTTSLGSRIYRAWPHLEGKSVAEVRAQPGLLNCLDIQNVTDHYDRIVRQIRPPPIIMGHSFGGLIEQLLLNRGIGAAGIAVEPASPSGVSVLNCSTVRSASLSLAIH